MTHPTNDPQWTTPEMTLRPASVSWGLWCYTATAVGWLAIGSIVLIGVIVTTGPRFDGLAVLVEWTIALTSVAGSITLFALTWRLRGLGPNGRLLSAALGWLGAAFGGGTAVFAAILVTSGVDRDAGQTMVFTAVGLLGLLCAGSGTAGGIAWNRRAAYDWLTARP
ncbi:MAG: hypothetical protein ACRD0P_00270 [Stackebrandtia sp.]